MSTNNTLEENKSNPESSMFARLVSNHSDVPSVQLDEIDQLTSQYPYSQILASLKVLALPRDSEEFNTALARAALLFPRRDILYRLIHNPEGIKPLPGQYSFIEPEESISDEITTDEEVFQQDVETETVEHPDQLEYAANEEESSEENHSQDEYETWVPEIENEIEDRFDVLSATADPSLSSMYSETGQSDEQEIQEEIQDLSESDASTTTGAEIKPEVVQPLAADQEEDILESDVLGAAMSDYFAFESADIETAIPEMEEPDADVPVADHHETNFSDPGELHANAVSNYNDSKLPYTFLWWLDKTRREHAGLYQPYAQQSAAVFTPVQTAQHSQLDQQIVEHVFHLKTALEDEHSGSNTRTVEFKLAKPKDELIERFIKEEPQIKPLKAEQINNENKARKSAEDGLELVSETLATIYIEQMLYDKAIEVYRKLSLKFPDKNLYFADQIKQLEQKII